MNRLVPAAVLTAAALTTSLRSVVPSISLSKSSILEGYESDELRYSTSKEYNEEGTLTSETEDIEPLPVEKMAKCRRYEAESGWYGLMTADGKVITPPSYCSIQAIGYDLYLCKDNDEDGVILNGKGQPTKERAESRACSSYPE